MSEKAFSEIMRGMEEAEAYQSIPNELNMTQAAAGDSYLPFIEKHGDPARAERMLARAETAAPTARLVEKWELRLVDLDRAGVAARQARLWADEHPGCQSETDTLSL